MKYELTQNTKKIGKTTLTQIRASEDLPQFGVKKGDLGGWIESEASIKDADDSCWIFKAVNVFAKAKIYRGKFRGGQLYGGVFKDGLFLGGVFYGGVFWGGEFWGGIFISLTRHVMNICSPTDVQIGCLRKSIDDWLDQYQKIGKNEGYTEQDITLYGNQLQFLKDNWDALAPKPITSTP